MDHQVLYFIFGFLMFGAIQAAWIDHRNRGRVGKTHHKGQIDGGCFYNMCNETVDYPEDKIRKLVEQTPGYQKLFGIVLQPRRKAFTGDHISQEENQETNMCGTHIYYANPRSAIDIYGNQQIVVNGDGMEQLVEYETCDQDAFCVAEGHVPGQIVSCRVQEVIIRLFVYTETLSELEVKSFAIPAGCYCAAKLDNYRFGKYLHDD